MDSYLINGNNSMMLTHSIKELIKRSTKYIKACNFLFQDKEIIELLQQACDRGVAVFIISNIRLSEYSEDDEKKEESTNTTLPNLNALKEIGCHVHLLTELHAKFVICDGMQGILMSANFSANSLDKNTETGIPIFGAELSDLEYVFEKLYLSSDITDIDKTSERNVLLKKTRPLKLDKDNHLSSNMRFTIASEHKDNNLYNCRIISIYNTIVGIINKAQKYVYIVTWHFKNLEQLPEFKEAIEKAIKRGVNVVIYSNYYGKGSLSLNASRKAIDELKHMGCRNYGDDNNHSKCVISENDGILFTANIDGKSGMHNGFEAGCKLSREQISLAYQHINKLIEISKKERYE